MKVFKFGGASVRNADAVRNVARIIRSYEQEELLIVVSAMGKTTNQLERLARAYFDKKPEKAALFQEVKQFHADIIHDLLGETQAENYHDIDNTFIELDCLLDTEPESNFDLVYDSIVSYGEIISSRIISNYMNAAGIRNRWVDAQNFIVTDATFREGKVDWVQTDNLIAKKLKPIVRKQIVLTQGFIGKSKENQTITLGREGSDYSAAIFAYGLDADSVTIWKDVDGVMNADPKLFPDAVKLDGLSYSRTIEMAFYGATVIHPKTMQPLQQKNIPLFVRSFVNPSAPGTKVGVDKTLESHIPTFIFKQNQRLVSISGNDFSFIVEDHLSHIFSLLSKHAVKVNLMQNSALSFSIVMDDKDHTDAFLMDLQKHYKVRSNEGLDLLTVTGYTEDSLRQLVAGRQVLIEQRTRATAQLVLGKA